MHKILTLLMGLCSLAATALDSITANFYGSMPSSFTIVDGDACALEEDIYRNLPAAPKAWDALQVGQGHGRVALSPTRNSQADLPADNWMILPYVDIISEQAIVRWEACSMLKHLPESYSLMVRTGDEVPWTPLVEIEAENHQWTTRLESLAQYAGEQVQLAFIATTLQGFILAIDNIYVGVPEAEFIEFNNHTPHFLAQDEEAQISGILSNYGASLSDASIEIQSAGNVLASFALPALSCGESIGIEQPIDVPFEDFTPYQVVLIPEHAVLASGYFYRSSFKRTNFIDRCSGLWCNNCPIMDITTERLEAVYGDELIVTDTHVNDVLANSNYWDLYLSEFCFAVPMLVPNHDSAMLTYSLDPADQYAAALCQPTICEIELTSAVEVDGRCDISTIVRFDHAIDNSNDRYRIGYLLLSDIHSNTNRAYRQSLANTNFNHDQLHYMHEPISQKLMYFENVPTLATAVQGISGSLYSQIQPYQDMEFSTSISIPAEFAAYPSKVLVFVIDTLTGSFLNVDCCSLREPSGIVSPIVTDAYIPGAEYYNLQGQAVAYPRAGQLLLRKIGNKYEKTIKF